MINPKSNLQNQLLQQDFSENEEVEKLQLKDWQKMGKDFAQLENGIAILSDLKNNKSYIYSGKLADELHIFQEKDAQEIESIWEDELFNKLNPEDVLQKHVLELQFFQMMKMIPFEKRSDFCVMSRLRILNSSQSLIHKMFYFSNSKHHNVELALCLYHFDFFQNQSYLGMISNTSNGTIIYQTETENSTFLSLREKEILKMIKQGRKSKEIAEILFISINTVNRHRQNILEKMRVSNTTEACILAMKMNWI
ncbi:LuxR C-terminal-related transcriptional regulator [Chryseobacterium formosus]|uniref:LuxR C-terminal-related transcriptional regulator n=1 Tax=Chryseobacterium formosus TaxID=1537363 RepID=A0ABT3XLI0_9FLAO|nr:LuxR C-terminal-related transcriptional regulator [Chryseobacterium formosus]MCX8522967.1 LuxR C-terminal-related transcriptional regulator [Chryseobacterium formosus]